MSKIGIAILASGSGTTAEAFIRDTQRMGNPPYDIRLVVCNSRDAKIFERVEKLNAELHLTIESTLISGRTHPEQADENITDGEQTLAEQRAILETLGSRNIGVVVLLGYMKHVGALLIDRFGWQPSYTSIYQAHMLNTHPGLLPATKGLYGIHVQEAALASGATEAGQTLHVVAEGYDDGPAVAEHRLVVNPGESAKELFARVQLIEKANIAADIAAFVQAQENYERKDT